MALHLGSVTSGITRLPRLALVSAALVLWSAGPAVAQNGYISGRVRDAVTLSPLAGITVEVCSTAGCQQTVTQSQGGYFYTLPPGTYWVFTNNTIGYTNEIYDNILCQGECSPVDAFHSGHLISVQPTYAWNASFDLDPGARIGGTVTSSTTAQPIAGVTVRVYADFEGWPQLVSSVETDASGQYLVSGLPAGRYFLRTENSLGYVNEIYGNVSCPAWCGTDDVLGGQPIEVATGASSPGRDFDLDPGGHVTGTVTDAGTSAGQAGVCVYAIATSGAEMFLAGQACTDPTGAYDVGNLPAGSYLLWSSASQSNHVPELFDGLHCAALTCDLDSATRVAVTPGGVTAGRNFSLDAGGIIRGVVRDATTSQPIEWVTVYIGLRTANAVVMLTATNADPGTGEYEVWGLATGSYVAFTSTQRHQNEIFDDVPCRGITCMAEALRGAGTPIAVTEGLVTSGIDFGLRGDIPPGQPSAPSFRIDGSTVTVSWSPPYYGGQASSYILEAGSAPGATFLALPLAGMSYVAPGVAPGIYYVRIRAVNAFGVSPASPDVEIVVSGAAPSPRPGSPGSLRGWMSGSRVTLMWESPSSGSASATGYVVEAGSGSGLSDIATIAINARAFTFLPVAAGVYFVRVRAMNAYGLGPASNEVLINSGFVPAPPQPPFLDPSVVTGSTVTLTWESPSRGPVPASYVVRAGSGPGLWNLAVADVGAGTTATFTGVPPGRYYVRVHGVNVAGLGLASNEILVVVR